MSLLVTSSNPQRFKINHLEYEDPSEAVKLYDF